MAWPALARRVAGGGRRAAQDSSVRRAASTCARHALVAAARPICAAAGPAAGCTPASLSQTPIRRACRPTCGPRWRARARRGGAVCREHSCSISRTWSFSLPPIPPEAPPRPRTSEQDDEPQRSGPAGKAQTVSFAWCRKYCPPRVIVLDCCGALFPRRRRGAIQSIQDSVPTRILGFSRFLSFWHARCHR